MKLLTIDCSTQVCRLGLAIGEQRSEEIIDESQRHTDRILSVLDGLLSRHAIGVKQLDAIAVAVGPGSFTGVRVAIAVAQAISFAHHIPVVTLSSLNIMAQAAYRVHRRSSIVVAIDARMREVYWGIYQLMSKRIMHAVTADSVTKPEALQLPKESDCLLVGNARPVYFDQLSPTIKAAEWDTTLVPGVEDMFTLAMDKVGTGDTVIGTVLPNYVRDDVAQKSNN